MNANLMVRWLGAALVVLAVACTPPPPGSDDTFDSSTAPAEAERDTGSLDEDDFVEEEANDTAQGPGLRDFGAMEFAQVGSCGTSTAPTIGTLYDARVNVPGTGSGGTIDCAALTGNAAACWVANGDNDTWNHDSGTSDTNDTAFTAEVASYSVLYCACPANSDCDQNGNAPTGFPTQWTVAPVKYVNDCTDTGSLFPLKLSDGTPDTSLTAIAASAINVDEVDTNKYDGIDVDCKADPSKNAATLLDDEYDDDEDSYIQDIHRAAFTAYRASIRYNNAAVTSNPGIVDYRVCAQTSACATNGAFNDCVDDPAGLPKLPSGTVLGVDIHPAPTEAVWYDQVDQNCDGKNDFDQDMDTYVATAHNSKAGGTATGIDDCVDTAGGNFTHPGAASAEAGAGATACSKDVDLDNYGDIATGGGYVPGTDCDDSHITIKPGGAAVACDGADNDCGVGYPTVALTEVDNDNDGYVECDRTGVTWIGAAVTPTGGLDCKDDDAATKPGATQICDGINNICLAGAVQATPPNEVDGDGDHYVDCKFDVATAGDWKTSGTGITGDKDCNDAVNRIFPGATEDCDGYHDNCNTWTGQPGWTADAFTSGLTSNLAGTTVSGETGTGREIDDDGDKYVECSLDISPVSAWGTNPGAGILGGSDCADSGSFAINRFVGNPEVCDGLDNDCDTVIPLDEVTNDTDNYVECDRASIPWRGAATTPTGGLDCKDDDGTVYPTAPQLCDGINNTCLAGAIQALPPSEADADGDRYVDCKFATTPAVPVNISPTNWKTTLNPVLLGDRDCNDTVSAVGTATFPGATENCDGLHTDCNTWATQPGWTDPLVSGLSAALGSTVVAGETGTTREVDDDGDKYVECSLDVAIGSWGTNPGAGILGGSDCLDTGDALAGTTMPRVSGASPWAEGTGCYTDVDGDHYGRSSGGLPTGGLPGVAASGTDCNDDTTAFGINQFPTNPEVCDGLNNDCASGVPANELDSDSDSYVECDRASIPWRSTAPTPTGGLDCRGNLSSVKPGATEACDGYLSNCSSWANVNTPGAVPASEIDNDNDTFVECTPAAPGITFGVSGTWGNVESPVVLGVADCRDDYFTVSPAPTEEWCDGFRSDCDNWATPMVTSGAPAANEIDDDNDTFVECVFASGITDANWGNVETVVVKGGGDCVDSGTNAGVTMPRLTGVGSPNVWLDQNGCYTDVDGDQYGRSSTGLPTTGFVVGAASGEDCDDTSPSTSAQTFPGAASLEVNPSLCRRDDDLDNWGDINVVTQITQGTDCEDRPASPFYGAYRKPGLTEVCDGLDNDCASDIPDIELDGDSDGFVECAREPVTPVTATSWKGPALVTGGLDCRDNYSTVKPGAAEVCDGYMSNCTNWPNINTPGTVPTSEIDDDDDTYVDCAFVSGINAGNWGNDEAIDVVGGGDCIDSGNATFAAVTKPRTTGSAGWLDLSGCYTDADGDHYGRNATGLPSGVPGTATAGADCDDDVTTGPQTFPGAAPSEPSSPGACRRDNDQDDYGQSGTPGAIVAGTDCNDDPINNGLLQRPGFSESCDGLDNDCLSGVPTNETDDDGDHYIECGFVLSTWEGPGTIVGGLDCADAYATVFPGQTVEECDGYPSNCSVWTNISTPSARPALEIDDDNDGYVECTFATGITSGNWGNQVAEVPDVSAGGDCFDDPLDATAVRTHPGAASAEAPPKNTQCLRDADTDNWGDINLPSGGVNVQVGTDCDDSSATAAVTFPGVAIYEPLMSPAPVNTCMRDRDGDGWGDMTPPSGVAAGRDCVDAVAGTASQYASLAGVLIKPSTQQAGTITWSRTVNETFYDGIDQNCYEFVDGIANASDSDFDADGDLQLCRRGTVPAELSRCPAEADGGLDCVDDEDGLPKVPAGTGTVAGVDIKYNASRTAETWYDGVDQNCLGDSDYDQDGDTYTCSNLSAGCPSASATGSKNDCHDLLTAKPATINGEPGVLGVNINILATEKWYDGIDQNCAGDNDFDQDLDGYIAQENPANADGTPDFGSGQTQPGSKLIGDCIDDPEGDLTDAGQPIRGDDINPAQADVAYDGVDQNCDGLLDYDADGDTFQSCLHLFPNDDDDSDGAADDCDCWDLPGGTTTLSGVIILGNAIKPTASTSVQTRGTEVYYNGVDQNCDGKSDFDRDLDGYDCDPTSPLGPQDCPPPVPIPPSGLRDCNDQPTAGPNFNPTLPEVCEGTNPLAQQDNDCDGSVNTQAGGYFFNSDQLGNGSRGFYFDADTDTFGEEDSAQYFLCSRAAEAQASYFVTNDADCDDLDKDINPAAKELCNDRDDNCDPAGLEDEPTPDVEELPAGCVPYAFDQDQDGVGNNDPEGESICVCPGYSGDPNNKPPICNPPPLTDAPVNVVFGGTLTAPLCWSSENTDCRDTANNIHPPLGDNPVEIEYIDGFDNDCDNRLAVVELDCDNDGAYALLPMPPGSTLDVVRDGFTDASQVGLAPCSLDASPTIKCFGDKTIPTSCDLDTHLYEVDTATLEGFEVFADGARTGQVNPGCTTANDGGFDCDDNCPIRCEGLAERCDGVDNDCAGQGSVTYNEDLNGLPDTMEPGLPRPGYVGSEELDLDGDGQITCTVDGAPGQQTALTDQSCTTVELKGDCNDMCWLVKPEGGEEICNGFLEPDDCVTPEGEGFEDGDGDRFRACGAWGNPTDSPIEVEQIFMLLRVDSLLQPLDADDPRIPGTLLPLIPAREKARECDSLLADELEYFGITGVLEDQDNPALLPKDEWWVPALSDCIKADVCRNNAEKLKENPDAVLPLWPEDCTGYWQEDEDPDDGVETGVHVQCGTVGLTLSDAADEDMYTEPDRLPNCLDENETKPEQVITRTVWSHDRIVAARRLVVEWECYRLNGTFGCEGEGSDGDEGYIPADFESPYDGQTPGDGGFVKNAVSTPTLARLLESDDRWWKELSRYDTAMIQQGALLGCWGDPVGGVDRLRSFDFTGGDCNSDSELGGAEANRDMPEGPDDLVGVYNGVLAECSTCLDGIDNNCNEKIDCADPACARCFVGQGIGCSASKGSPCVESGCSYGGTPAGGANPGAFGAMFGLALAAAGLRRKKGNS